MTVRAISYLLLISAFLATARERLGSNHPERLLFGDVMEWFKGSKVRFRNLNKEKITGRPYNPSNQTAQTRRDTLRLGHHLDLRVGVLRLVGDTRRFCEA